jgi:hypothetical protein
MMFDIGSGIKSAQRRRGEMKLQCKQINGADESFHFAYFSLL